MSTIRFPQLRVRTGYTYRDVYGRLPEVLDRLDELEAPFAAIVDHGTWGHSRFEQAAKKAKLPVGFGMEIPILDEHDEWKGFKPRAWVLGTDSRSLYNLTSEATQAGGLTSARLATATGVVRFLGGAVWAGGEPEAYDCVDINPASVASAHKSIQWARFHGKPMVLTSYNDMPDRKHQSAAYSWEVRDSVGPRHLVDVDDMCKAIGGLLTNAEIDTAIYNTFAIAEQCTIELAKAPIINVPGDLRAMCSEGARSRVERGHIAEWNETYAMRLKTELEQIQAKGFDSYFIVVSDLIRFAKKHMLVGPARGSSAGSLVCYLLDITEVDPIPWDLLFHRFIDISRDDLPDIDIDFADTHRYMAFDFLKEKYGADNVAKLGNIMTLQPASVFAQVGKKFGIGVHETMAIRGVTNKAMAGDVLYGHTIGEMLKTTDVGQDFAENHPAASLCMTDLEVHPSHAGVHAAGILVCNEKITDFCTVTADGIAQIDKPDAEYLNLLKIDALGLRTLGIIQDAGVITSDELFALRFDDQSVLDILNDDKVSGVFQFEGDAVRGVTRQTHIDSIVKIDNINALARPGPLGSGMAQKYINRVSGKEKVTYDIPELESHLSNSYGIILYQEQVMSIVNQIGCFDWVKTSAIRKAMSKSKGKEYFDTFAPEFVAGAVSLGIDPVKAQKLWDDLVTFGGYGFNKSHSFSYAVVTYWTLYMKRYHPVEFAAACLRSAKDDEQVIAILRELAKEGVHYTAIDPEYSDMNWVAADGRLIGGILNAKGYGPVKAAKYVAKRAAGTLTDKDRADLTKAETKYGDLNEAHTKWGHFYARPRLAGVTSGNPIVGMKQIKDRDDGLVIGKLIKKTLLDENEASRVKKRGGKLVQGNSKMIDLFMVDDSTDSPMRFRIRPDKFEEMGAEIHAEHKAGSWYLVKGWKISGIDMFIVKAIKRIDE